MLDCWTGIDFLLVLQSIRDTCPQFINDFFLLISSKWFYRFVTLFLFFGIYWFVQKEKAEYCLINFAFVASLTHMLKYVVKEPRPHIIEPKIEPMETNTSYSMPSSHTSLVTSGFGSIAIVMRQWWVWVICAFLILVIPFSRLWLGAHTPLDVIIGFVVAIIVMVVNWYLLKKSYESERNYYMIGLGYIAAYAVITLVFILNVDTYSFFANFTVAFAGTYVVFRLVEHKYIGFVAEKNSIKNIAVLIAIGYGVAFISGIIVSHLEIPVIDVIGGVLICLWCIIVYPYLMKNRVSFFSKLMP